MKQISLLFALVLMISFSTQSCKKSNNDPEKDQTNNNQDPDPDPEPLSKVRGKWYGDSTNTKIYIFGNLFQDETVELEAGSFIDFYTDTDLAIFDGNSYDSTTYVNNNDQTLTFSYLNYNNTFIIETLTDTRMVLSLDTVLQDPTTGVNTDLELKVYNHK